MSAVNITKTTRLFSLFAGLGLAGVSIIYTVMLTLGLATTAEEKVLMATAGVGFEVCKFIFFPVGLVLCFRGHNFSGIPLLLIGTVLIGLSITASLGFLTSTTNEATQIARVNSDEYKLLKVQLEMKKKEISISHISAERDSQSRYFKVRARGTETLKNITELQKQYTGIMRKMKTVNISQLTSAGALFDSLGILFQTDPVYVRSLSYFIFALLIELCGIAALTIAGVGSHGTTKNYQEISKQSAEKDEQSDGIYLKSETQGHQERDEDSVPRNALLVNNTQDDSVVCRKELDEIGRRIRHQIINTGLSPVIRVYMSDYNIGFDRVIGYFNFFVDQGILIKDGSKYLYINDSLSSDESTPRHNGKMAKKQKQCLRTA